MNDKKLFETANVEITDIYSADMITASPDAGPGLNQDSSEWPNPTGPWM